MGGKNKTISTCSVTLTLTLTVAMILHSVEISCQSCGCKRAPKKKRVSEAYNPSNGTIQDMLTLVNRAVP